MRRRCYSPTHKSRIYYYDRKIGMCEAWFKSYLAFKNWAYDNGYEKGLEIDRIDNNKGYSPDNCRFADHSTNQSNKSNNVLLQMLGENKIAARWAEDKRCAVDGKTFRMRLFYGWEPTKALITPTVPRSQRSSFVRKRRAL